ncbi:sensor histidine kinase [Streptosporangium lutulentum]|uniref:histidine kinase n=1 Tax=Streptosporangium lutulentum TaxID=1461250 RepID=A0ABT9Q2Y1_9ACTN|nr:HAMP domain-containing sensor histidine kinase [Streptosporangium lutulentum]MDP9841082.1 signal transduction histidine kinase [Streptosporangium lutulentum]
MNVRNTYSIKTRLTLVAVVLAAVSGVALTVIATISLYGLTGTFKLAEVTNAGNDIARLIEGRRLPAVLPEGKAEGIQVLNSDGQVVAATPNLVGAPRITNFTPSDSKVSENREVCGVPRLPDRCVNVVALRSYQPEGDWIVYSVGSPVPWYVHPGLFALIAGACLLTVLISGLAAYRTVTAALTPVNAIRKELEEITETDIGRRVPVPPARDEIRQLAETINQTLDRLENTAEQQRRFASDASHDLRSPLTAMRAQVEEALHYPEDVDWKTKANAMIFSLDRLQAIVSDLLMLARLDSGVSAARERIDLGELVGEELDRRKRCVEVSRELSPGVMVIGDRLRLARLLTNLADNAERHAASRITVNVTEQNDMAVLEVIDDGAGIAPEQREVIFRRFTRLDAARNKDAGGTGLGLPIAREIAEAHGGTLKAEDGSQGARFVLRLPLTR